MPWVLDKDGVNRSGIQLGWHALVLGVRHFPALEALGGAMAALSSPGPSVRLVQDWVLGQADGFASLVARVGPAPDPALGVSAFDGTTGAVARLIDEWLARVDANPANGGWLYLCTHGVRVGDADHGIFAEVDPARLLDGTIDLTASVRRLRHGPANRLFCSFDLCRTDVNELDGIFAQGTARVVGAPDRSPGLDHSLVFWAARKWAAADGSDDAPSKFSRALVAGLKGLGAEAFDDSYAVTPTRLSRALDHQLGGRRSWTLDGLDLGDYAMVSLDGPPSCDAVFLGSNVAGAEVEATALALPDEAKVRFVAQARSVHHLTVGPWRVDVAGAPQRTITLDTPQSRIDLGRFVVCGLMVDPRDPHAPVVHGRVKVIPALDRWVHAGEPFLLPAGHGPVEVSLEASFRMVLVVDVQGDGWLLVDGLKGTARVVTPSALPAVRTETGFPVFKPLLALIHEGLDADQLAKSEPDVLSHLLERLTDAPLMRGGALPSDRKKLLKRVTAAPPFRVAGASEGSRWTRSIAGHPMLTVPPNVSPHTITLHAHGVMATVPVLPGDRLEVVGTSPRWRVRPTSSVERNVLERWLATGHLDVPDPSAATEPLVLATLRALARREPDGIPALLSNEADGLLCRALMVPEPEARQLLERWNGLADLARSTPTLGPVLVRALARAERLSHPAADRLQVLDARRSRDSGRVVLIQQLE